jgi:hypothetical protein
VFQPGEIDQLVNLNDLRKNGLVRIAGLLRLSDGGTNAELAGRIRARFEAQPEADPGEGEADPGEDLLTLNLDDPPADTPELIAQRALDEYQQQQQRQQQQQQQLQQQQQPLFQQQMNYMLQVQLQVEAEKVIPHAKGRGQGDREPMVMQLRQVAAAYIGFFRHNIPVPPVYADLRYWEEYILPSMKQLVLADRLSKGEDLRGVSEGIEFTMDEVLDLWKHGNGQFPKPYTKLTFNESAFKQARSFAKHMGLQTRVKQGPPRGKRWSPYGNDERKFGIDNKRGRFEGAINAAASSGFAARQLSPFPAQPAGRGQGKRCYKCGRHGHIKSDCPN